MPNTRRDNKNPRPIRSVSNRKIHRNQLKKKVGSNKINYAWYQYQKQKRAAGGQR